MAKCEDSMLRTGKNLSKYTSFPQRKNYFKENLVGCILRLSIFFWRKITWLKWNIRFPVSCRSFSKLHSVWKKKKKKKIRGEFWVPLCKRKGLQSLNRHSYPSFLGSGEYVVRGVGGGLTLAEGWLSKPIWDAALTMQRTAQVEDSKPLASKSEVNQSTKEHSRE